MGHGRIIIGHTPKIGSVNIIGSSGNPWLVSTSHWKRPNSSANSSQTALKGNDRFHPLPQLLKPTGKPPNEEPDGRQFYEYMYGYDWEMVVDQDKSAIVRYQKEIGVFFHKELQPLKTEILLTANR